MRLSLLALFAGCLAICSAISAQPTPVQGHKSALVLYRSPFGFCFSLPENWKGYAVVEHRWQGIDPRAGAQVTDGPLVLIRNPKWTADNPREDIPIMVFTLKQWQSEGKTFIVGADPFGPSELGRNSKYVFALPARYNCDLLDGWEEVDHILKGDPLRAPCVRH